MTIIVYLEAVPVAHYATTILGVTYQYDYVAITLQLRYDHVTTLLLSSSVFPLPNMFMYGLLCCLYLYMLIRIIVILYIFFTIS